MRRRPLLKCRASAVLCPNPQCRHLQRDVSRLDPRDNGEFKGQGKRHCDACDVGYFFLVVSGAVEVIGLWPEEYDAVKVSQPLSRIYEQLGLLEHAA